MTQPSPEIRSLCNDIEMQAHRKIRTPYDFEQLSTDIWEQVHQTLSPTTLKRLWGYVSGAEHPRQTTLSILSAYLGYSDWEAYLQHLSTLSGIESETFQGDGIRAEELTLGDRVEVTWLPNRRCVFRYLGEHRFVVEEAAHAKLAEGDRCDAVRFFIGQPMYLDQLERKGQIVGSYVAGKRSGLVSARRLC